VIKSLASLTILQVTFFFIKSLKAIDKLQKAGDKRKVKRPVGRDLMKFSMEVGDSVFNGFFLLLFPRS
jgi:hypothetical protein